MTSNPDGPYYDDDDLINDYMEEDDFGPPPDYDDLIEEMMEDHPPKNSNADIDVMQSSFGNAVGSDNNVYATVEQVSDRNNDNGIGHPRIESRDNVNQENVDEAIEESYEDTIIVPTEVTVNNALEDRISEFSSRRSKDNQLYSFQRYNDRYAWRKKSSLLEREEQDVMSATAWKQKVNIEKNNKNTGEKGQKPNAPASQLVQFLSEITKSCMSFNISSKDRFQMQSNLPVENEESSTVTVGGGKMFFVPKIKNDIKYLRCDKLALGAASNEEKHNLLGIPMSELVRRAEIIERKNDRRKRMRTRETRSNKSGDMDRLNEEEKKYESEDDNVDMNSFPDKKEIKKFGKDSQLWVDKHAPTSFTDLLSDERTNREVLRALRQWDPYVFQKESPPRPQLQVNNDRTGTHSNFGSIEVEKFEQSVPKTHDLRPDEQSRVILLSGAPGVGKTTLAHIVARHAGYRPLEVNASDERSASVLTERVTRAMESATLNFKQPHTREADVGALPNCLILDEIDGADAKSSIAALVEIIRAEKPVKGDKKKGKKTYLRRPIIFICNHKFAPALRPLLPFARQFDVSPPSPNRLVSRLKGVLTQENMTLVSGSSLLRELVTASGGDIRSCLYTLQFAAARAREISNKIRKSDGIVKDYHKSVVDISPVLNIALNGNGRGMKDIRSDMSGTLRTIFRKLKNRKVLGSKKGSTSARDIERVLNTVESFMDSSKTLDGLFLNLLNVSYIDPTLDRCWTAHEWLSCVDVYRSQKSPLASNNYAEHRVIQSFHIPSAAAAVHVLCRVETNPVLTFSLRPLLDSIYQLEANSGLINKFFDGLNPKSRSGVSSFGFTSEVLPYCLRLLSAGVGNGALDRAVSSVDILTKEEKIAFNAHVEMLRILGLTYKKVEESHAEETMKSEEIEMRFEPEIDKVFQFQGLKPSSRQKKIPPALKELLAHAASVADLRSKEQSPSQKKKNSNSAIVVEPNSEVTTAPESATTMTQKAKDGAHSKKDTTKVKAEMNFLGIGAARAKAARSARKAAQVGCGRRGQKKVKKLSNTGSGVPLEEVIRFKYQRGFTQAVRLPCNKNDFTIL